MSFLVILNFLNPVLNIPGKKIGVILNIPGKKIGVKSIQNDCYAQEQS